MKIIKIRLDSNNVAAMVYERKRERKKNQAITHFRKFYSIFIVVDISFADIYIYAKCGQRVHCLDEVKRVRPS